MDVDLIDTDTGEIRVSPRVVFVRSAYNYSMDDATRETELICEEETRAQQQFKEECDINTIVERFGLTGELPQNVRMPLTQDFCEAMDYKEAQNLLLEAHDAFMQFPANVRERFANDAGRFVEFASDPANIEECRRLGLAPPAPVAEVPPGAADQ